MIEGVPSGALLCLDEAYAELALPEQHLETAVDVDDTKAVGGSTAGARVTSCVQRWWGRAFRSRMSMPTRSSSIQVVAAWSDSTWAAAPAGGSHARALGHTDSAPG
eukprot:SAG25_NODE_4930_length_730_cov_0.855784_2_plen_106_part_00